METGHSRRPYFGAHRFSVDGRTLYKGLEHLMCRTKLVVRVDSEKVRRHFCPGRAGIHRIATFGDLRETIRNIAVLTGLELVEEDKQACIMQATNFGSSPFGVGTRGRMWFRDEVQGGFLATKHLLEMGRTRIVAIDAPLYILKCPKTVGKIQGNS